MKTAICRTRKSVRSLAILCCCGAAVVAALPARATTLYYDITGNPGWFAANAWGEVPGTYDTDWIHGASAIIALPASAIIIDMSQSTNVSNLTLYQNITLGSAGTVDLTIDGGDLTVNNAGFGTSIGAGVTIQGNYTLKGGGWLQVGNNSARWSTYAGTGTIENGTIEHFRPSASIGTNSNFVVTGGTLRMGRDGTTMGSLTIDSGTFLMGRSTTHESTFIFAVSSLSGTGGTVRCQGIGGVVTFVADQSGNTSFDGDILGAQELVRVELEKDGAGDLALSGTIDLRRTTTVSGGRLYINSAAGTAEFADEVAGTTAISVDGGTLGGTGTVTVTDNADVVVSATGKLTAGIEGVVGRTTYSLNGGTLDLSAATASANTGWLKFDLGDPATPGVTYDQILLSGGALNIGTGLDFDAFDIQLPSEPQSGSYVLFETGAPIIGSLGNATGTFEGPSRITGALRIDVNNLVLDVSVPPTGTVILLR